MGSESMPHVHLTRTLAQRSAIIRHHNDNTRRFARAGVMYVTAGVVALGKERMAAVLRAVREFDGFNRDNDPYDEHDMGIVSVSPRRAGRQVRRRLRRGAVDDIYHGGTFEL